MNFIKRWWKVGLIVLGIIILGIGTRNAHAADVDALLGIANGQNHTAGTVQRVGLQLDRKWFFEFDALSERSGPGGQAFALGRIAYFRDGTNVSPFIGVGGVYLRDYPSELVGCSYMWHWRLGVEVWRIVQLAYVHDSSADRCKPNQGIDHVGIDFRWRF